MNTIFLTFFLGAGLFSNCPLFYNSTTFCAFEGSIKAGIQVERPVVFRRVLAPPECLVIDQGPGPQVAPRPEELRAGVHDCVDSALADHVAFCGRVERQVLYVAPEDLDFCHTQS